MVALACIGVVIGIGSIVAIGSAILGVAGSTAMIFYLRREPIDAPSLLGRPEFWIFLALAYALSALASIALPLDQ